ncbi:MAG: hypothetical protein PF690_01200 [Deltaproteobacteria bacterium]|jgi:hypothetical protein|nr:hypothetical protein [Deltaproteobacteria bacterium]
MNNVHCKKDTSLTKEEKDVFTGHLKIEGLSHNIWDLFEEWVEISTSKVKFFYLKVYQENELIGLGLFLKIKPLDLTTSYSRLRKNALVKKIISFISLLNSNCVYISFRNLITSNLTRPFFYREPEMENIIMKAILTYLKDEKEADMVTIVDTSRNDNHYQKAGFDKYPSSSEAYFDATKYADISEYLNKHKSLKKNLKRKKDIVTTEILQGPISKNKQIQIKECLYCSIKESRVNTPSQQFFEDNIFETEVYNSDKYIHIFICIDNRIIGFHTFIVSGSNMGGVLGGFNRDYSRKSFAYERVIVASLDYAIKNKIKNVQYSLVDNYTKLRLVESLEPCGLYFYSRSPMNRSVFKHTLKYSDVHELYLLEKHGLLKKLH